LLPENAKRVFKGQIFDVYQWQQEVFDGTTETFEMLKRADTLKVLAIKDGKIVVLHEEQPHQPPFIDIPGGRHDYDKETELEAAQRELLEETGMTFETWKLVSVVQPHSKIDWFVYLYIATDFKSQTDQKLDAGEKIEVQLYSLAKLKNLVNDPKNRYLPKEVLEQVSTIEELSRVPAFESGINLA
jgi:ADP-ribose pyrophosphatase